MKLRRKLRVRTFLNRWRRTNVRGQIPNTRMRSLQAQVDEHILVHVCCYRHARRQYLTLIDPTAADSRLRELRDSDVRGLSERLLRQNESQEENASIASRV